jgi:hypothetical protein
MKEKILNIRFFVFLLSIAVAIFIFWLLVFVLGDYISSLIPNNEWHKLISFMIKIVICYSGGIAIPLGIILLGIMIWIEKIN